MHAIICVTTDYPYTQPMVAILVELTSGQREPYDIQIKVITDQVLPLYVHNFLSDFD